MWSTNLSISETKHVVLRFGNAVEVKIVNMKSQGWDRMNWDNSRKEKKEKKERKTER